MKGFLLLLGTLATVTALALYSPAYAADIDAPQETQDDSIYDDAVQAPEVQAPQVQAPQVQAPDAKHEKSAYRRETLFADHESRLLRGRVLGRLRGDCGGERSGEGLFSRRPLRRTLSVPFRLRARARGASGDC